MRAMQEDTTVTIGELRWARIPPEPKKLYVLLLLNDGYTREAIGAFFGTTKNAIVGFQYTHLPRLTGKAAGTKEAATLERLEELVAAHEEQEFHRLSGGQPRCLKLATTEATQCEHRDPGDRMRCAREWTNPDTRRCDFHPK